MSTATPIVAAVLGATIVLLLVLLVLKSLRLKRLEKAMASVQCRPMMAAASKYSFKNPHTKISMDPIEKFIYDVLKEKPIRFTSFQLAALTQNFAVPLGSGGFGDVYRGDLPTGVPVAVKVLKVSLNKNVEQQFMAEVGTIGRTYHVYLVKLFGFCFEKSTAALIYEFMENGSLDKYLFDEKQEIGWTTLHDIAVGTAKGIRYCHEECQQKIVHYDIKPANVLLNSNFKPKVSDFGLAMFCDRNKGRPMFLPGRGTPGYAAPELWMSMPVNYKCDVYSYGMLLFEILGRRKNFEQMQAESRQWFPRWVTEMVDRGEVERILSHCRIGDGDRQKAERMCKVALWCVQYEPEKRPDMSTVVRMLEGEEDIVMPPNPFFYLSEVDSTSTPWTVALTESGEASSTTATWMEK